MADSTPAGGGVPDASRASAPTSEGEVVTSSPRESRPPWALRLKVPAWLALVAILVTVLVAFFLTGPSRSTARSFDTNFQGTQQVVITYCLSNAQAVEAGREPARADLEERLRELGVKDPKIEFTSPCPSPGASNTSSGPSGPPHTGSPPAP